MQQETLEEINSLILRETKIIDELVNLFYATEDPKNSALRDMGEKQMRSLKKQLEKTAEEISATLEDMSITKPLPKQQIGFEKHYIEQKKEVRKKPKDVYEEKEKERKKKHKIVDVELSTLERKTLKRLKKKSKASVRKKNDAPSAYVSFANSLFGKTAKKLSEDPIFISLNRDILKANLKYVIGSYISTMILSGIIAFGIGVLLMIFFLFFTLSLDFPIVFMVEKGMLSRLLEVFWIPLVLPLVTVISMYVYPAVEKSYLEGKINQELPFATIHMSAIAGSMVEPSKMFSIIIATKEYPFLEKEFTKLINQINVYGYDFVSALRNVAANSASTKLTELLNGLATTITSGGELTDFFDKRAQSLLFDYRIEREKYTKSAETFMDIYISLVIAAPMILMLLLIMMRVSGLGIALSTSSITLIMILGVSAINFLFAVFLQLKQPSA